MSPLTNVNAQEEGFCDSCRSPRPGTERRVLMSQGKKRLFRWTSGMLCVLTLSFTMQAAMQTAMQNGPVDPGVRGGAVGAGGPMSGLTVKEGKFFDAGL